MIRIVVVDDDVAVRELLRVILDAEADFVVAGEAASAEDALDLIEEVQPDVVLMAVRMPGLGGIEGIRRLAGWPDRRPEVVALTTFATDHTAVNALRAGAAGFAAKADALSALFEAVRIVAGGDVALAPGMLKSLLEHHVIGPGRAQSPTACTPRELEVLQAVGTGADNTEIATALCVSEPTVRSHLQHLRAKLGATSRARLVALAWEMGLIRRP